MVFLLKSMYLTICLLGCFLNFRALYILFSMPECFMYCTYLSQFFSLLLVCQLLIQPTLCVLRIFCPWNSGGKNTRVGSYSILQGIPTYDIYIGKILVFPYHICFFLQFEKGFLRRLAKMVDQKDFTHLLSQGPQNHIFAEQPSIKKIRAYQKRSSINT